VLFDGLSDAFQAWIDGQAAHHSIGLMTLNEGDHFPGDITLAQGDGQIQGAFVEESETFTTDAGFPDPPGVKDKDGRTIRLFKQRRIAGTESFLVHPDDWSLQSHGSALRSGDGRLTASFRILSSA